MCSCPKCGRRPIRRKLDVRKCRHCGVLPDPLNIANRAEYSRLVEELLDASAIHPRAEVGLVGSGGGR